jgi:hypothetical protein
MTMWCGDQAAAARMSGRVLPFMSLPGRSAPPLPRPLPSPTGDARHTGATGRPRTAMSEQTAIHASARRRAPGSRPGGVPGVSGAARDSASAEVPSGVPAVHLPGAGEALPVQQELGVRRLPLPHLARPRRPPRSSPAGTPCPGRGRPCDGPVDPAVDVVRAGQRPVAERPGLSCHCAVSRVIVAADRPAPEPTNCSDAGPSHCRTGRAGTATATHLGDLRGLACPRRQDRRGEPPHLRGRRRRRRRALQRRRRASPEHRRGPTPPAPTRRSQREHVRWTRTLRGLP